MRTFSGSVLANLTRAICSTGFFVATLGTFLVITLGSTGLFTYGADVIYLLGLATNGSSAIILVVCVLPTLPFSTTFASEWNERSFRFWMIRTGVRVYTCAKIVACAVSGFLVTFLGLMIFIAFFSLFHPIFISVQTYNAYSVFLVNSKYYSYLFLLVTHISLSSSIFAVLSLYVSSFFQNCFTTVAMPVVTYMAALRLSEIINPPAFLDLSVIIETAYNAGSPLKSIVLKLVLTIGSILILGQLTSRRIRKLVHDD